jgi:hypothetical protein
MKIKTKLLTGASLEAVRLFEERAKAIAERRERLDRELEVHHAAMWEIVQGEIIPGVQPQGLDVGYLEEHGLVFLRYMNPADEAEGEDNENHDEAEDAGGVGGLLAAGFVIH